jgi:hypothetical protein
MPSPQWSNERFVFTLWTADRQLAAAADAAGVDRIGVDLERLGKEERQAERGTWISPHREEDLDAIAPALSDARLFARVNPLNPDSEREVESVLRRGAQVLMLPMVMSADDAAAFVRLAGGRTTVVMLVEHARALDQLRAIVRVAGVDEIHIGLNDLAISLGLPNRWVALADGLIDDAAAIVRDAHLRFGLGGIGRAGDASLPIPSDLVYAELARTGATAAVIARSFFVADNMDWAAEIVRARQSLDAWRRRPSEDLAMAHAELGRRVARASAW